MGHISDLLTKNHRRLVKFSRFSLEMHTTAHNIASFKINKQLLEEQINNKFIAPDQLESFLIISLVFVGCLNMPSSVHLCSWGTELLIDYANITKAGNKDTGPKSL